ncbi:MAG: putative outer membrane repeat protein, partial [Myxococcota bacterium]
ASGCGAVCEACGNDGDCTGGQPNEVGACRAGCCRYGLPAEVCGNPFDENGDGVQDEDCTWFVDAAALLGGDGTTWDQAFTTLNAATTAANAGDRVWVASATYISADASPILVMKQGVDIYGGFIGDETAMAQRPSPLAETALDGTFSTPQIALAAPSARLDGFILRNAVGNASGAGLAGNGVTGLTVTDCTFDSNTGFQGGAFYNVTGGGGSENRFERVVFSNNTVTSDGGAVHTLGPVSARVFVDCQFINNTASGLGGAMRLTAPTLLERCTFVSNRSTGSAAGAIHHATASYLTIVDSTFAQNEAATVAGAISTESAATTLSITGTLFQGNQAISAGAIRARFSTLDITASVFEANSATSGHGGAITVEESLFTLNSSRFSNNTASGEGGGIRASTLTAGTTADTQWQCNTAGTFGGALRATDSPLVLHNPTFYGNGAANGGGLAVSGGVGGGVEISGARLTHNSATGSGGAIHCASATLTVEHSDVAANAANLGAGVYSDCVTTVVNSGFDSNAATTAGGGLHLGTANDSTLLSNTLVNNTSPTGSGSSGGTSIRNSVVWNNQLDNPGSSSNICTPDTDPIERGPHQQLFLTPTSTCINAGNAQHNTDLFSDWANWTTQSDGTLDSPPLDAGRHYTP